MCASGYVNQFIQITSNLSIYSKLLQLRQKIIDYYLLPLAIFVMLLLIPIRFFRIKLVTYFKEEFIQSSSEPQLNSFHAE